MKINWGKWSEIPTIKLPEIVRVLVDEINILSISVLDWLVIRVEELYGEEVDKNQENWHWIENVHNEEDWY